MDDKGDDGLLYDVKTNLDIFCVWLAIVTNELSWCQINLLELFIFSNNIPETLCGWRRQAKCFT